jgi:Lon protease-like protein
VSKQERPAEDEPSISAEARNRPVDEASMEAEPAPSTDASGAIVVPALTTAMPLDPELPSNVAILPSRDAVLYPGMLLPLQTDDQQWIRLLSESVSARQPIGLFMQLDPTARASTLAELHRIGTAANVVRLLKLPDGTLQVLLQGVARISLGQEPTQIQPYLPSRRYRPRVGRS